MKIFLLLIGVLSGLVMTGGGARAQAAPVPAVDFSAYAGVYYSGQFDGVLALTLNSDGSAALDGLGSTPATQFHYDVAFFNVINPLPQAVVLGKLTPPNAAILVGFVGTLAMQAPGAPLAHPVIFSSVPGSGTGVFEFEVGKQVYAFCTAATFWQVAACNGQGVGQ
jgi:hypothetical protein